MIKNTRTWTTIGTLFLLFSVAVFTMMMAVDETLLLLLLNMMMLIA